MKPKKILCLFDYVARTGFGTVSKNIVQEIKKHYGEKLKLDIIAINYFGEPYEEDNINVISARRNDVNDDPYGRYFFLKVLKENKDYDGVFICQDLGVIVPFIEIMQHIKAERKENNQKSFKSIFYFPVDCHIIYELTRNLEFFDLLVTYTEFGRKEVLKFKPELKTKLKVLPHGNNSKDFYPLPEDEKIKFRKEFFGENADKFIVTNVNRNQPRKDIPNTIFGFVEATKIWDKNLPKPFLYLHMHPNDPMGWDIRAILMQTDLKEDIDYKIYPKEFEEMGADISVVNKIYNASDVYITTTLGEGWGLTFSEAASCKIPIIAPYTTSFMEMSGYGKNAYMLENIYPICQTIDNVIREHTDIYEIADNLLHIAKIMYGEDEGLNLKDEMNKKIENSYNWIKKLEWNIVCKQWVDYFKIY
jgi:glycosyltransferase involved in cell wall biosynthesis